MGKIKIYAKLSAAAKLEYDSQQGKDAYRVKYSYDSVFLVSADLFESCSYPELKTSILADGEDTRTFWYQSHAGDGYVVTKYVPNLKWFLIIDHDTSALAAQLNRQLLLLITVVVVVIAFVLLTITGIIRKYNRQIIALTMDREQEQE